MTEAAAGGRRIATLDIVRGVAVMGILAMNIAAFAMPFEAYMNPTAYGLDSDADLASWLFAFVVFDGKMRGLFSFLFGASALLVIERAKAKNDSPAAVHYRRMLWLLLFGYLHFLLIWYGDILAHYALIGFLLWFFRDRRPRTLIIWGAVLVAIQFLLFAGMAGSYYYVGGIVNAPGASPELVAQWAEMQEGFGIPTDPELARTMAVFRGSWADHAAHMITERAAEPVIFLFMFGWETLAYMLFGMAGLKTGFFSGEWSDDRYRRAMLIGFGIGIPIYVGLGIFQWVEGFSVPAVVAGTWAGTVLFRPLMIVALASLIIVTTRSMGALAVRLGAAGRMAFTNYLATSILMTALFYGWGLDLFGSLSRIELWLPVIAMWMLILAWSKPWLEHFHYGPFEWLWRSLSRWEVQPMRKRPAG